MPINAVADAYMLTLVSFDSDFDHTQRGRKTPAQIVYFEWAIMTATERMSAETQDAITERLLEALDEQYWDAQFAATTDEQWARIAACVRAEIAAGLAVPLDHNHL